MMVGYANDVRIKILLNGCSLVNKSQVSAKGCHTGCHTYAHHFTPLNIILVGYGKPDE